MKTKNQSSKQISNITPSMNIRYLHETAENILEKNERYLKDHIYPALHCPPESEEWVDIEDFARGSIIAHNQFFMGFTIIDHYRRYDIDYLAIAKDEDSILCFELYDDYARNLVRFSWFNIKFGFESCRESIFIGKTVRDIVTEYDIPSADEIPYIV